MSDKKILIGPFVQAITLEGLSLRGPIKDEQLAPVSSAGVLIKQGKIQSVGKYDSMKKDADEIIELDGQMVCLPAFVDAHTHICFGGSRARDYAARNNGKTYLEIAKAGGGIWDTVTKTREATSQELVEGIIRRGDRHLRDGVTTIEIKSGYGLSVEEELKMLYAIKKASHSMKSDVVTTCLAAHILPRDFDGNHEDYLQYISSDLFPILKKENLTNRIDAFIEEEAFSNAITTAYFDKAKKTRI